MMEKSAILPTQTLYPSIMLNNLNLQNHSPNQQKGKRSDNLTSTYDAKSSSFAAPLFRYPQYSPDTRPPLLPAQIPHFLIPDLLQYFLPKDDLLHLLAGQAVSMIGLPTVPASSHTFVQLILASATPWSAMEVEEADGGARRPLMDSVRVIGSLWHPFRNLVDAKPVYTRLVTKRTN